MQRLTRSVVLAPGPDRARRVLHIKGPSRAPRALAFNDLSPRLQVADTLDGLRAQRLPLRESVRLVASMELGCLGVRSW